MFVAGKFIWIVAQPLSLAAIAAILTFLAIITGRRKLAGFFSLLASVILFLTLFTSLGAWSLQRLEARYPRRDLPPKSTA